MSDTVYFLVSKALQAVLVPEALFIAGLFAAYLLLNTRKGALWGRRLLGAAMLAYVVFAIFPVGVWALSLLEDRYPVVQVHEGPVAGIIVLGGALNTLQTRERGLVTLTDSAERMTEFVRLARAHPEAKLVFSGGSGRVFDRKPTEADVARRLLDELGMDVERVHFEDTSRNTTESAVQALDLAAPQAGETWILITSARHMPRAMGLFQKAGWQGLRAHPVDHVTPPGGGGGFWPSWPGSLGHINMAVYEWGGLVAARLRGRTDELFPGPSQ